MDEPFPAVRAAHEVGEVGEGETAAVLDEAADDFEWQVDSKPAGVEVDAKALLAELQDPLAGVGGGRLPSRWRTGPPVP